MKLWIASVIIYMALLHTVLTDTNNDIAFEKVNKDPDSLTLICTSKKYEPSSLGIYMKYDKERLNSSVSGTALVYHIERLKCKHMGTYICRHNSNPRVNSSLTVQVGGCEPQLCPGETQKNNLSCDEKNAVFSLCIISPYDFTSPYDFDLIEVLHYPSVSEPPTTLNTNRYEVAISPQGLYYDVDVRIRDITHRDCGMFTLKFQTIYDKTLYYDLELSTSHVKGRQEGNKEWEEDKGEKDQFGPRKSLVFTSEIWDPVLKEWRVSTSFLRGSTARLVCIPDNTGEIATTLRIRKSTEANHLSYDATGLKVIHRFGNTDCDKMGTYVCENEDDVKKTINVGIIDCEPQLCNSSDTDRVIFVAVYENLNINLCVRAYPGVDKMELVESWTKVRTPGRSTLWTWSTKQTAFGTHEVIVSFENVTEDDVGRHTFGIFTSYNGNLRQLKHTFELKHEGPPNCPHDILVTHQSTNSIMLSWQPGSDEGAEQLFRVYISEDNVTWAKSPYETIGSSLTITDLKAGTGYAFKVISRNKFTQYIDETLCNNVVYDQTVKHHPVSTESVQTTVLHEDEDGSPFTNIGVQIAFAVILFCVTGIAATVGIFVCFMKGSRQYTRRNDRHVVSNTPQYANDDARNRFITNNNESQEHIYTEII